MPDPRELRVGDRIRFVSLPEEWKNPDYHVRQESVDFMKLLISRRRSCRVAGIEEDGYPWINARVRLEDGTIEHHGWGVYEATGWRKVQRRSNTYKAPSRQGQSGTLD